MTKRGIEIEYVEEENDTKKRPRVAKGAKSPDKEEEPSMQRLEVAALVDLLQLHPLDIACPSHKHDSPFTDHRLLISQSWELKKLERIRQRVRWLRQLCTWQCKKVGQPSHT